MSSTENPTRKDDSLIVVSKNELHELHHDVIDHIKRLSQEMDRRFERLGEEMDRRFERFGEEMNSRFAHVDRRFEQVDKRFEQVDRRFDAIDERFDAQDRRFEAHDKCFAAMEGNITLLGTLQQSQEARIGELTRHVARVEGDLGKVKQSQAKQLALLEDIRSRLS